ncbi:Serine protease, subtilisin family [Prauserella marina]|uniref:Serine protease, subtilisin family n=1 Tax=Prauserella marina TaxID=530584 RepID=A0A1G6UFD1_9PSEU|nr:S8 family serine peptidase [Prauserella marina]PWV74843.1 subtilisin family serine protease [Prauserella marina]SDD39275.1 Serine protease, subtilisin family [Prauserella marina]
MTRKHHTRKPLAAVLAALVLTITAWGGATVVTAPAAVAQDRCVPPGTHHAPVPWPQHLLAPDQVWPLSTGRGQRVAVIGTGVETPPQLAGKVSASTDLAPADTTGRDSGRTDCLGIGTGVAGIIAANPEPGTGFRGMAPGATVLSAKVVGDSYPTQSGDSVDPGILASALDWAVGENATVIAVPVVSYRDSPALRAAVDRALRANTVIVAAVGDTNGQDDAPLTPYPAAYPGVLAVGAIDTTTTAAGFSRTGPVDLVAPGDNITTTQPGHGLAPVSGTAYAAAYTAATTALVRSYYPDLPAPAVVARLKATAAPAPETPGSTRYGAGIINPHQAITEHTGDGAQTSPNTSVSRQPPTDEEIAAAQATMNGQTLGYTLTAAGIALTLLIAGIIVFGPLGKRRNWRPGNTPTSEEHLLRHHQPEPPRNLFDDLNQRKRR